MSNRQAKGKMAQLTISKFYRRSKKLIYLLHVSVIINASTLYKFTFRARLKGFENSNLHMRIVATMKIDHFTNWPMSGQNAFKYEV